MKYFLLFGVVQHVVASTNKISSNFDLVKRAGPIYQNTEQFGEPHGSPFNDAELIRDNVRVLSIDLSGCGQHLGYLASSIGQVVHTPIYNFPTQHPIPPKEAPILSEHGKEGGGDVSLSLAEDEYIKQIDLATYRAKTGFMHRSHRTRIGYIKLTTSKGHTAICGSKSDSDPFKTWKYDGYAFLHFSGSTGDAIDALSGTFIRADKYFV